MAAGSGQYAKSNCWRPRRPAAAQRSRPASVRTHCPRNCAERHSQRRFPAEDATGSVSAGRNSRRAHAAQYGKLSHTSGARTIRMILSVYRQRTNRGRDWCVLSFLTQHVQPRPALRSPCGDRHRHDLRTGGQHPDPSPSRTFREGSTCHRQSPALAAAPA